MDINNTKDLEKFLNDELNNKIISAMDGVGERALNYMKDYVKRNLEDYDPKLYVRTNEYLNSIVRTKASLKNGWVTVSIEYNIFDSDDIIVTDLETHNLITAYQVGINPPVESDQNWNWHADFNGNDVSEFIPLWMEYGTENRHFSHDGIYGILHLKRWVKRNIKILLIQELKKVGITAK